MSGSSETPQESEADLQSRFPTVYSIPFALIVLVAVLTWIIPAGQYDREMNEEVGRDVAVPGTYQTVESNPQNLIDVLLAPIGGFYDPDSYSANAIDAALFVLLLGGTIVICAGGGGIPVIANPDGTQGVEAVIVKDATSALLAEGLGADNPGKRQLWLGGGAKSRDSLSIWLYWNF